jgi:sphinganine-1-phosphate aldolase
VPTLTPFALLATRSLRNIIFILYLLRCFRKALYSLRGYGVVGSARNIYTTIRIWCYSIFLRAPGVRSQVDKQVVTALTKLESSLVSKASGVSKYLTLPKEGWTPEQVRAELEKLSGLEHTRWEDGRVSGAVYHGGSDLLKLQTDAFGQFSVSNPIHPDVFPGVRKMEAEIVAMVRISLQQRVSFCPLLFENSTLMSCSRSWHCLMVHKTVLA